MPKKSPKPTSRKVQVYVTTLPTLRTARKLSRLEVVVGADLKSEKSLNNAECGYGLNLMTALKLSRFYGEPVESIWTVKKEVKK